MIKPKSKVKKGNVFIFLMLLGIIIFYFNRNLISSALQEAGINPNLKETFSSQEEDAETSSDNLTKEVEVTDNQEGREENKNLKPYEKKKQSQGFDKSFYDRGKEKEAEKEAEKKDKKAAIEEKEAPNEAQKSSNDAEKNGLIPTIGGKNNGLIALADLKEAREIILTLDEEKAKNIKVISFWVAHEGSARIINPNRKFRNNTISLIEKAKKGDIFEFTRIKVRDSKRANGKSYYLKNNIVLEVE